MWVSPLQWPTGQKRAPFKQVSRFEASLFSATTKLENELRLLGAKRVIATSNLKVSKTLSRPLTDQRQPEDRGVAVYFELKGQELCIAVDRWYHVEDNVHAIALSIGAIRGLERWGGGDMVERSFQGFAALPASTAGSGRSWSEVLGIPHTASPEQIRQTYRQLVRSHHPDLGGDREAFEEIQRAYEEAMA